MQRIIVSMLGAAVFAGTATLASAQSAPPDFSGVYYPVQQGRGGAGQRAGGPPGGAQRGGPPP